MGYYYDVVYSNINIKRENFEALLDAFEKDKVRGVPDRAAKPLTVEAALEEIFDEHGFTLDIDREGIVGIEKFGEKWINQEQLFYSMGPFVEAGGYIDIRGEDDAMWQYTFDGSGCDEHSGFAAYETSGQCPMKTHCLECPFSLLCVTDKETMLREVRCGACNGLLVMKGKDILARTTCTCKSVCDREFVQDGSAGS